MVPGLSNCFATADRRCSHPGSHGMPLPGGMNNAAALVIGIGAYPQARASRLPHVTSAKASAAPAQAAGSVSAAASPASRRSRTASLLRERRPIESVIQLTSIGSELPMTGFFSPIRKYPHDRVPCRNDTESEGR